MRGNVDSVPVTEYRVDYYEENPGDPGQWSKGAPGATSAYSKSVQVDTIWLKWIISLPLFSLYAPHGSDDRPCQGPGHGRSMPVNLPIRCMWGGQPDRWFVRGWGGLTYLTTWVLAVWVVAGQDARNRRKRPVV